MGLDMHLTRKHYIGAEFDFRGVKGTVDITIRDKKVPINFNRISYICEEVCYWRKANQIHNWFVQNVQDGEDNCQDYYVSIEQLQELLDTCKKVKEKAILVPGRKRKVHVFNEETKTLEEQDEEYKVIQNVQEIAELLPTTSGFFFGSTEYNDIYMEDIDYTINKLEEIIKEEKEMNEQGIYSSYEYGSSW